MKLNKFIIVIMVFILAVVLCNKQANREDFVYKEVHVDTVEYIHKIDSINVETIYRDSIINVYKQDMTNEINEVLTYSDSDVVRLFIELSEGTR